MWNPESYFWYCRETSFVKLSVQWYEVGVDEMVHWLYVCPRLYHNRKVMSALLGGGTVVPCYSYKDVREHWWESHAEEKYNLIYSPIIIT